MKKIIKQKLEYLILKELKYHALVRCDTKIDVLVKIIKLLK